MATKKSKFCFVCWKPIRKPAHTEDGNNFCKKHKNWLNEGSMFVIEIPKGGK